MARMLVLASSRTDLNILLNVFHLKVIISKLQKDIPSLFQVLHSIISFLVKMLRKPITVMMWLVPVQS